MNADWSNVATDFAGYLAPAAGETWNAAAAGYGISGSLLGEINGVSVTGTEAISPGVIVVPFSTITVSGSQSVSASTADNYAYDLATHAYYETGESLTDANQGAMTLFDAAGNSSMVGPSPASSLTQTGRGETRPAAALLRLLTITCLAGASLLAGGQQCSSQESMQATIGHTTFTLTRELRPSVTTNRVTGEVAISLLLTSKLLGISFPKANGHIRDTIFVVLVSGAVYKPLVEGYRSDIRGEPLREFGQYSVYQINPVQELYVGDQFSHPAAFECEAKSRGILTGTTRGCDVREFLVPPPAPSLRTEAVVVDYGLSYEEITVLPALDHRIIEILRKSANIADL